MKERKGGKKASRQAGRKEERKDERKKGRKGERKKGRKGGRRNEERRQKGMNIYMKEDILYIYRYIDIYIYIKIYIYVYVCVCAGHVHATVVTAATSYFHPPTHPVSCSLSCFGRNGLGGCPLSSSRAT
jgi:hypothetical protein